MQITIDGHIYEFDGEWLVQRFADMTREYVDPESATGKRYADFRLGAKALIRLRLKEVLEGFAHMFHVDDWRTLKPKRDEDLLLVLHRYYMAMVAAEMQNLRLELESDHVAGHVEGESSTRLALTSAAFGATDLYRAAPRGLPNGAKLDAGRDTAALAAPSGSGLVGIPDTTSAD